MVGALVVALGGLDALVFTAGSARIRLGCVRRSARGWSASASVWTAAATTGVQPDGDVATADSPVRVLVIHTREDLMIAREARRMAGERGER